MTAFRENPEDVAHGLLESAAGRSDEIGVAQRELVTMQEGLRAALLQKTRLYTEIYRLEILFLITGLHFQPHKLPVW